MRTAKVASRGMAAVALLTLALSPTPALGGGIDGAPAVDADALLEKVGFAQAERQRILDGEIVTTKLASSSPRDLAIAVALLVSQPPEELDSELVTKGLLLARDPQTLAHGNLGEKSTSSDFKGLELSAAEKKLYVDARPGEGMNLSSEEVVALGALGGKDASVEGEMTRLLLARYQAYRERGLAGIAPYARSGGKKTDAAGDLRRASEAARALEIYEPAFYDLLLNFPKVGSVKLEQAFRWARYNARNQPTLMLIHAFSMSEGDTFIAVQRQYYVSRGYNVEQAIAGFAPVKQGTIVVYTNHTSTDQVEGFGGSAKRSIGEKVMTSRLEELFKRIRSEAKANGGP